MISAASSSSLSSGGAADDTVAATSDHGKSSLGPLNASVYKSLQTYLYSTAKRIFSAEAQTRHEQSNCSCGSTLVITRLSNKKCKKNVDQQNTAQTFPNVFFPGKAKAEWEALTSNSLATRGPGPDYDLETMSPVSRTHRKLGLRKLKR